ncbi:MAG TPA: hypothetical protein VEY67_05005, partial [Candidatus Dormibacteraeota bacterium]|nr:hypothetical protein [Candidatus Dormibacteraeota bacterium]
MSTERHRPSAPPHELLAAAASALARPRHGDPVAAVLDVVVQALGADRAAVFARDPERDDVALVASVGPGLPDPAPATLAATLEAIP